MGFEPRRNAAAVRANELMEIVINGESQHFEAQLSVAGLLDVLALEPKKIAVERNLEIVPKSRYGATALCDGDRIEIVQFVGGG